MRKQRLNLCWPPCWKSGGSPKCPHGDGLAVSFSDLFLGDMGDVLTELISSDISKVSESLLFGPIDYIEGKERQQTGLRAPKLMGVVWGTLTFSLRISYQLPWALCVSTMNYLLYSQHLCRDICGMYCTDKLSSSPFSASMPSAM